MRANVKQYAQVLFDLSKDKDEKELPKLIKDFVQLLVDHNQISKIDRIIDYFLNLWNKENLVIQAEIIGARKLDAVVIELLDKYIRKASQAKEIEVKTTEDKRILGGVILKYADNILDASIKTRLKQLERKIKS